MISMIFVYNYSFTIVLICHDNLNLLWKICGPGVERSLLDPKVVGSKPGGVDIGFSRQTKNEGEH